MPSSVRRRRRFPFVLHCFAPRCRNSSPPSPLPPTLRPPPPRPSFLSDPRLCDCVNCASDSINISSNHHHHHHNKQQQQFHHHLLFAIVSSVVSCPFFFHFLSTLRQTPILRTLSHSAVVYVSPRCYITSASHRISIILSFSLSNCQYAHSTHSLVLLLQVIILLRQCLAHKTPMEDTTILMETLPTIHLHRIQIRFGATDSNSSSSSSRRTE